jgi:hypothetical protein
LQDFLFDHLVGKAEQRQGHGKPERFGGLHIDNESYLVGFCIGSSVSRR